jgi:FtsH-binding integral membrane protein
MPETARTLPASLTGGPHMLSTILIVVLVLMLVGALPRWRHSSGWGYYPAGGVGLVLLILVILAITGRL